MIHVAGFNLSLLMRTTFGIGKPRVLQDAMSRVFGILGDFYRVIAATKRIMKQVIGLRENIANRILRSKRCRLRSAA